MLNGKGKKDKYMVRRILQLRCQTNFSEWNVEESNEDMDEKYSRQKVEHRSLRREHVWFAQQQQWSQGA